MIVNTEAFLEEVKLLNLVAEHSEHEIALLYFMQGDKLIAIGRRMVLQSDFNHGVSEAAVSIRRVMMVFDKISSDEVELTLSERALNISAGKYHSKVPLIAIEKSVEVINSQLDNVLPDNFSKAIKACQISVSKQKNFNWIFDNYGFTGDKAISTDGNRCTVYNLSSPVLEDFSIDKETAIIILKADFDSYNISDNYLEFSGGGRFLRVAKNVEKYSGIDESVFNARNSFDIKRENFLKAAERVKIFSLANVENVPTIDLRIRAKKIYLSSENAHGSASDKVKISSDGEAEITINPDYLTDILRVLSTKMIRVKFSSNYLVLEDSSLRHVIALVIDTERGD